MLLLPQSNIPEVDFIMCWTSNHSKNRYGCFHLGKSNIYLLAPLQPRLALIFWVRIFEPLKIRYTLRMRQMYLK